VGQPSVFAVLGYLLPRARSYSTRLSNRARYTGCDVISEYGNHVATTLESQQKSLLDNPFLFCRNIRLQRPANDVSEAPGPAPAPGPTVLTITTGSPINGTVNVPFNATLAAAAGIPPFVWSIVGTNQSPGPGLTLNSTTGVISGTPTSASITTQTYIVVDSTKPTAQIAQKALTISIAAAPQASISAAASITNALSALPTITPFALPNGTVNVAYPNIQLDATGGIPPYTWSVAPALPNGLFFNLIGLGIISGTPLHASNGRQLIP